MKAIKQYKANLNSHKPHYTDMEIEEIIALIAPEIAEVAIALRLYLKGEGPALDVALECADVEVLFTKLAAKVGGLAAWNEKCEQK